MDPISAAASVTAVLTIVLQTVSLTKKYIDSTRKSKDAASALLEELQVLSSDLRRLEEYLQGDALAAKNFGKASMLVSGTRTCEKRLNYLSQKFEKVVSSRLKQATWPFSEKEHRESMQELRAFSQWIQLSLSTDTSMLLSKASQDILGILTTQLRRIQQLDSIDARTTSMELTLQSQESQWSSARREEEHMQVLEWLSKYDHNKRHNDIR